jgi:hypothetical protein
MSNGATMTGTARLVLANGTGKETAYPLAAELTSIGQAAENQIVLADAALGSHHLSIARRNDRFALYVPEGRGVAIDGQFAPSEQWVWLRHGMVLQLTPQTALRFEVAGESTESVKATSGEKKPKKGDRPPGRKVAKFITDRAGGTLVRLGEDGHLPELQLIDADIVPKSNRQKPKETSPALLYGALGVSLLMSMVLLFLEGDAGPTRQGKAQARQMILKEFVGQEGQPLRHYQRVLREAGLAAARGDVNGERESYRRVLQMLNSEDRNPFTGITGSLDDDDRLLKAIGVLLSQ